MGDQKQLPAAKLPVEPGNHMIGIAADNYLHPLSSQVTAQSLLHHVLGVQ